MIGKEIVVEIDETIDRLIKNATAMNEALVHEITKTEIDAFQKTQESLVAHLIHMDNAYKNKAEELKKPNINSAAYKIRQKLRKFEQLNKEFVQGTKEHLNVLDFKARKLKFKTKKNGFSKIKHQ